MVQVGAYQKVTDYYNQTKVQKEKQQSANTATPAKTQQTGYIDTVKEQKLSQGAQDVLKKLRNTYGDMDFMVADFKSGDDAKKIMARGTKEFSVLFSPEELEKMAADENYYQQKVHGIEGAVSMSEKICELYGYERVFGEDSKNDTLVNKFGIAFHDDGTTSFFAELEQVNEKQRDRIAEKKEEAAEAKKTTETKAAESKIEKDLQAYKNDASEIKKTTIYATSMEELMEKISALNWDTVKAEPAVASGMKYDFSV